MAVIIAPRKQMSRSAALGATMGESLSKTLGMLTQQKMMQQQQQAARFQQQLARQQRGAEVGQALAGLGVPEEMAQSVGMLPEKQQEAFFKQFVGSQAFGAQPAQGGPQDLMQMLSQQPTSGDEISPRQAMDIAQTQREEAQTPEGMQAAAEAEEAPQVPGAGFSPEEQEMATQVQAAVDKLSPEQKKELKQEISEQRKLAAIPEDASREAKAGYRVQAKPTAKKSFKDLLATPRPTKADIKRAQDLEMKKEAMSFAKQKEINKNTKSFFDETLKKGKGARDNDMRLNRMTELLNKGNLSSPLMYSLLDTVNKGIFGFGINLKSLMNTDSQEFEKLTTDFTKNAKDIFGSRVTQSEINLFLKTIPNLSQSDKGKKRVLRNWKLLNEGSKLRKKAMLEIIEMNGGERPLGLQTLVEKKVGPKLDQIAKAFTGKKKKKQKADTGILGSIFGGIESARKYLNPRR